MSEKKCHRCKVVKPLSDFAMCKSHKDGKQNRCKVCDHEVKAPIYDKQRAETAVRELAEREAKAAATEKACPKCKCMKRLADFHQRKANIDGRTGWCKDCVHGYRAEYYSRHPEESCKHTQGYYRANPVWAQGQRIRKYWPGSTWQEALSNYEDLVEKHGNRCAICGKHRSEFDTNLSVDHNHITGEVRGLLCKPCNYVIGMLNGDINADLARKALEYIEKYHALRGGK